LEADAEQLRQLLQNLVGNALEYHREGESPRVRVYGTGGNDFIQIFVEDNSIGFDEKYLDRIFKPFQRLHGRTSSFEGTGMGLAICRKIVERHGGSITARSIPGEGSTFVVTLPVRQTSTGSGDKD
jgi:signal transduction histidine kinase